VTRWDENEWEMFAGPGPDVTKEDIRLVALGTLVAADKTLLPVVNLAIEEGLWRDADPDSEWHPWGKPGQGPIQSGRAIASWFGVTTRGRAAEYCALLAGVQTSALLGFPQRAAILLKPSFRVRMASSSLRLNTNRRIIG